MKRVALTLALLLAGAAVLAQPSLYQQAATAERDGKMQDAIGLYTQAARSGDGKAAFRLGEIYEKGLGAVRADYQASLKWFNAARTLGYPPLIGDFPKPPPR